MKALVAAYVVVGLAVLLGVAALIVIADDMDGEPFAVARMPDRTSVLPAGGGAVTKAGAPAASTGADAGASGLREWTGGAAATGSVARSRSAAGSTATPPPGDVAGTTKPFSKPLKKGEPAGIPADDPAMPPGISLGDGADAPAADPPTGAGVPGPSPAAPSDTSAGLPSIAKPGTALTSA